jgi:hypothetical protein
MQQIISKKLGLVLTVLTVMMHGAAFAATPTVTIDLITHNEILIRASPDQLWPLVVAPNSWKKGPKLISTEGSSGQLGERLKAVMDDGQIAFFAENVDVVPKQRRVIRLNTVAGNLIGYASFQLTKHGAETLVQYDVYSTLDIPLESADATPEQITATRKAYHDSNYRRFNDELAGLKKRVEGS